MDREKYFLKFIAKDLLGIEVGPWYSPVAPKAAGYRCLTLDVFDADTLRQLVLENEHIPDAVARNVEEVDLHGATGSLKALVEAKGMLGQFDYVISSHNIEHLPDPLLFLQNCGAVLKEGGVVSLAVPDRRTCYDYFRPLTMIGDWIAARYEGRIRPSAVQAFNAGSLFAPFEVNGGPRTDFTLNDDPRRLMAPSGLLREFELMQERLRSGDAEYHDTHCWTFTPASLLLLLVEARYLGLSPFDVIEVSPNNGLEFYAHLRNVGYAQRPTEHEQHLFNQKRLAMLHAAHSEAAANTLPVREQAAEIQRLNSEMSSVIERCREQQERIAALENSTSWRVTAPLRWLRSLV
ncbi:MAG: methyltransferase domain-containing protein [Variovorax sp.]|nr:methyltransferase domain-containing protein [Variovorax sp.]|tara:strand:- start:3031 stop:4077 length:1047 start_codon:yes stop_codon:yes gene_type:complete